MSFVAGVKIEGVRELRSALRRMKVEGSNKALRSAHKDVAKFVEGRSRGVGTAQQVKASRAILGKGQTDTALIAIRNLGSVPFGIGAFMGSVQYKQFPAWVGQNWDIEAGDGPYVIAPIIASGREDIIQEFENQMRKAAISLGLSWN